MFLFGSHDAPSSHAVPTQLAPAAASGWQLVPSQNPDTQAENRGAPGQGAQA
jgi:hypothetical protein